MAVDRRMSASGPRWQHALVDEILQRKLSLARSKWALPWAVINTAGATMLYFDIKHGSFCRHFSGMPQFLWHLEFIIAVILTLNAVYDIWIYLWPTVRQNPLELTPIYKQLFRVKDTDIGFKSSPVSSHPPSPDSKVYSPMPSFVLPSSYHSSHLSSSPSMLSSTPINYSADSWKSASMMSSSGESITSKSWTYIGYPPSYQFQNVPTSIQSYSMYNYISESAGLRNRWETSNISSGQSDSSGNASSFWNYPHASMPFSPILRKYQYQTATRSAQSSTVHDDDPDSPATHSGDSVWNKLKVTEDELIIWIANLRKWMNQTILVKLVSEIDTINDDLQRLGSAELQIGEVSLSTLRQVALTKSQHVPTLNGLLPYLDVTSNQEYLIQRLRELAKGGCMSEFRWNSGGSFKGKPWSDHLPTDCAIIMHVLCTYMDSRLPPDPHYPDGKTFTSQYFKKTPDKFITKDTLCIYQSRVTPPHYRVIIGGDTWDFPKGRNNMFFAILFFLHHIKMKQCGMLGRVNLGLSGVNILWVIDS